MTRVLLIFAFVSSLTFANEKLRLEANLSPALKPFHHLIQNPELLYWATENRGLAVLRMDEATSSAPGKLMLARYGAPFPTEIRTEYLGEKNGEHLFDGELRITRFIAARFQFKVTVAFIDDKVRADLHLPISKWVPESLVDRVQRGFSRAFHPTLQRELADYFREASKYGPLDKVIRQDHERRLEQRRRTQETAKPKRSLFDWLPIIASFIGVWSLILAGKKIRRILPQSFQQKWDALRL